MSIIGGVVYFATIATIATTATIATYTMVVGLLSFDIFISSIVSVVIKPLPFQEPVQIISIRQEK